MEDVFLDMIVCFYVKHILNATLIWINVWNRFVQLELPNFYLSFRSGLKKTQKRPSGLK